jgi:uncharacterized protein (TIGR01370 family)
MPPFDSYALQFSNVTAAGLANTGAELIITESALNITGSSPTLTAAELAGLAAAGKTVVAYVNTSVTDHARSYWNPAWVTPTNPDEPDVGVVNNGAPAWLANNLGGVDFAPEPGGAPPADEAILVDYRNADWRALVVAQAVEQVRAGYGGVFLDDVGRYFEAGNRSANYDPRFADSMMQLVIEVAAAVRAVNPAAKVIVNSGIYIGGDSTDGTGGDLFTAYKAAIDGMIIENLFSSEADGPGFLSAALATYPGVPILALESLEKGVDPGKLLEFAGANPGLLPYVVPNEDYASFGRTPVVGSASNDVLAGAATFANLIGGLAGNDRVTGGQVNDTIYGHTGNDSLYGGSGNDSVYGGSNNDYLYGDAGDDRLYGGTYSDRLYGGAGKDALIGGTGSESLFGGTEGDSLFGGDANDTVLGEAGNDLAYGGNGIDALYGSTGNDTLYGGADNDLLRGDSGNDQLYGGSGKDQFVFVKKNGDDRLFSFTHGQDRLDLQALDVSFKQAKAAMEVTKGGILLDLAELGGSGTVLLEGQTDLAAFTAGDFIL